jgi:choloylglycine hydrolase
MCTAVTYRPSDHYFGRNLDLWFSYQETVTITPRNYPFHFRRVGSLDNHYAMIGMATTSDGYPLYYEATNEKGLSMAGLNFPEMAVYQSDVPGMDNIAPFEFIPWILGQCATVGEAKSKLETINLTAIPFSDDLPLSPLHWIIADRGQSITVEPTADGLRIYDNPVGVLTNNPPFDFHLYNLRNYLNVSIDPAENRFSEHYDIQPYSNGMGGIGLPGDYSSASRFVKAAFVKLNSVSGDSEDECVGQFFRILSSVAMPRGCVRMEQDNYEITVYSCCCNTDKGIYYYTNYDHSRIIGVDMHRENLDGHCPVCYPIIKNQTIEIQN